MAGIHSVAKVAGIKDQQAFALFNAILSAVNDGKRVYVKDFGSFIPVTRKARKVYSPQIPGGEADVPERRVIRFRASPVTRKVLNGDDKAAKKSKSKK